MANIKLSPLPEGWETELLDWVSACQSAYHIDNTPGHRFGGLGSNLEENRSEIVCFVRGLLESHATALQSQDRADAERYRWLRKHGFKHADVELTSDLDGDPVTIWRLRFYIPEPSGLPCEEDDWTLEQLDEAIDHARRIEGEGE